MATKPKSKRKPKPKSSGKKRKRTQKGALVKGYLEKKDRYGFEYLLPKYKGVIGDSSGIYALYNGNKLYYVGIALNLLKRVAQHLKDKHKKKWNKVSFFVINRHRFSKDIETVILRIAEPKGNGTKGKFEKHFELQDKLKAVVKEMKYLIKRV
jgi:predicted GIY-YIG superfamily endonuclease